MKVAGVRIPFIDKGQAKSEVKAEPKNPIVDDISIEDLCNPSNSRKRKNEKQRIYQLDKRRNNESI